MSKPPLDRSGVPLPWCYDGFGYRQDHHATGWLYAPDGKRIVPKCRKCAQPIITEYAEKLGEHWTWERLTTKRKGKLYRYQRKAVKRALRKRRLGLFMEVGTGKTRVAIETCRRANIERILVVLPLSAIGVWRDEVRKWDPDARVLLGVRKSIRYRASRVRALSKRLRRRSAPLRVYVLVGYESYWRRPLREAVHRYQPQAIIYDEAHRIKSRTAKQSRFAHSFLTAEKHVPDIVLALTGTPTPNGPQDAFSIFKAVDLGVFGPSYPEFERRYLIKGGYMNYEVVGYQNEEELRDKIARNSFRITKADALDLPGEVDVKVPFNLSNKGRATYDTLAKEAIAEIRGVQGSGTALSKIVLASITRLQQCASGFVRVEDGRELDFDFAKRDTYRDLLEDLLEQGRVIVFARFRHDVDVCAEIAQRFTPHVYRVDGRVHDERKVEQRIKRFREHDHGVFVMQIQKAVAIDLSCASVAIFYGRNHSLLDFEQARGRLHRHGQKQKVTYYHLLARRTIEPKVQKALAAKRDLMKSLLDRRAALKFFS